MGKKISIHQYFVSEADPFSQKKKFNGKTLGILAGSLVGLAILVLLVWGGETERKVSKNAAELIDAATVDQMKGAKPQDLAGSPTIGQPGSFYSSFGSGAGGFSARRGGGMGGSNRQYTASQLVRPGDGLGGSTGDKLPIGSLIPLRLLNRVVSSDASAPVIALVTKDVLWKDSIVIPEGTKAIGQAILDDVSKRLQVRFSQFVLPEGEQRAVAGIGLLPDGSSGIPGDYHSGETKKQIGRFVGTFVGGVADGMKDRQAGGQMGIALEPGSLKNGILNGLTQSAFDQGKLYAEDLEKVRPFLDVPQGVTFLLYLEREF